MNQRDFYQVLGVARNASPAQIRAAFVRLAKQHHPDHARATSDLPGRLHEVQQAYRCLSNTEARAHHDDALEEGERLHFARQRRVQRRLSRYDGLYPHPQPRAQPNSPSRFQFGTRWRLVLIAVMGAIVVGRTYLVG